MKYMLICFSHQIQDPSVGYVDLGASYVGPTQDRLLRISKELGVTNYRVNEDERSSWIEKVKGAYDCMMHMGGGEGELGINNCRINEDERSLWIEKVKGAYSVACEGDGVQGSVEWNWWVEIPIS